MTIKFNCPNCDALIVFDSKHAGKRGRCTTCGQVFIIPSKNNEKPKIPHQLGMSLSSIGAGWRY